MIFPGFPGVPSFFHVFQVEWEPWPVQRGCLYSEVQCIMGNGHMGPFMDRHTRLKILPYRKFGGK